MKKCKHCENVLVNQRNTFCNSSCSAKYNNARRTPRTEESKLKTALSVCKSLGIDYKSRKVVKTKNPYITATKLGYKYTPIRQCTYCKKFFDHGARPKTTCSDKCYIDVKTKLNNKGKKCIYNGIEMDSMWEKKVAQKLDELNIVWVRPDWCLEWLDSTKKSRKYFPDFYLVDYDIYLDPKNKQVQVLQEEKLKYLSNNYNNIVVGTIDVIMAYLEGLEPS
jgi:hypothetical protein